jgi:hypothetical protein
MASNIDKYKSDLETIIKKGQLLEQRLQYECFPEEVEKQLNKRPDDIKILKITQPFTESYQGWYSEALAVIKILLPDRLSDFIKLYEKPKPRKEITYENYSIEDALSGLQVTKDTGWDRSVIVDAKAALPRFRQQINILKSASNRFESSLFTLSELVRADLFDSELDTSRELNSKGFTRAAGAIAGVVLESHLIQVAQNHIIKVTLKNPSINDLNDLLKNNNVIEMKDWRFIQHLADIRNKCDHKKNTDPSSEEINDFIDGVDKVSKTIY